MLSILADVMVDNCYAAIGGLDLCFGRWDTRYYCMGLNTDIFFLSTIFTTIFQVLCTYFLRFCEFPLLPSFQNHPSL